MAEAASFVHAITIAVFGARHVTRDIHKAEDVAVAMALVTGETARSQISRRI